MAQLTIRPSRYATGFREGSYAYVVADRPVRRLGDLITPSPITLYTEVEGTPMRTDLTANMYADEGEDFLYTLSVFDPEGHRIYSVNFVMPDEDTDIFDMLLTPQDENSCEIFTPIDNSE